MAPAKNDCLSKWMEDKGFVKGRKWATQRLPEALIKVIRIMAEKHGMSPADMVTLAFKTNPDLSEEYERTLHPWAAFGLLLEKPNEK